MMLCSHSIPAEDRCQQCHAEALAREGEASPDNLSVENDRLRRALEFYAESGNWKRPTQGRSWRNSPAADDRGGTALLALLGLET